MTVTGHIDRLRQYVLDHQIGAMGLIGSSLGGMVALHYAHRFGGAERMLLLAPALSWQAVRLSPDELAQWEEADTTSLFHPAFGEDVPLRYDLQLDGRRYREPVPSAAAVTISAGLARGLKRGSAARFSFLLATPIILGAGLLKVVELAQMGGLTAHTSMLVVGLLTAAAFGFGCIHFLLRYLQHHRLYPFAVYCSVAGIACLLVALL